jgi:hypothetical protein
MAPFTGPPSTSMLLPCEVSSLSSPSRTPLPVTRGRHTTDPLSPLVLDALQTVADPVSDEVEAEVSHSARQRARGVVTKGSHHTVLVRCVYSDASLRERLTHPQVLVTTLTANYRSHPLLLMLPSLLFYGGSLEARAEFELTQSCLFWSRLARSASVASIPSSSADIFPLLCIGARGVDTHLPDSPSFWNQLEVDAVCEAITSLLEESRAAITGATGTGESGTRVALTVADIGVITPYRQQVLRIRRALRASNLGGVSVGVVSNFQGSEKKAIFISTVLSSSYGPRAIAAARSSIKVSPRGSSQESVIQDFVGTRDRQNGASFLAQPRAIGLFGDSRPFNVAVSFVYLVMFFSNFDTAVVFFLCR